MSSLQNIQFWWRVLIRGRNSKLKTITLDGFKGYITFFRIPEIEIYFFKHSGSDLLTLNGLLVSPGKINIFPNGASLKGRRSGRLYFSDVLTSYREEVTESNISFGG